jgi:maltokinase
VPTSLEEFIASSSADILGPASDRRAPVEAVLPLRLVAALELDATSSVAIVADSAQSRWVVPIHRAADGFRRAVAGDAVAQALVDRLGAPLTADQRRDGFTLTTWHSDAATGERSIGVDQTNESVIVGDAVVVKWNLRQPTSDDVTHPAVARLTALAGFTGTPQVWGLLQWRAHSAASPLLIADLTAYVKDAQDGWDWAVADVLALGRGELDMDTALAPAKQIGMLTARMHIAFAAAGVDHATSEQVSTWKARAKRDLARVVADLDGPEGERLRARAGTIDAVYEEFDAAIGTPMIAIHGDFHVGQVLRFGPPYEYVVTDFEGNPVVPAGERASHQPAALDVAGMHAAFDHVGRIVLHHHPEVDTDLIRTWISNTGPAFDYEYFDTLARMRHKHIYDERLVRPFRFQQEVREYLYALDHLPLWRYVPDGALADLIPAPKEQ